MRGGCDQEALLTFLLFFIFFIFITLSSFQLTLQKYSNKQDDRRGCYNEQRTHNEQQPDAHTRVVSFLLLLLLALSSSLSSDLASTCKNNIRTRRCRMWCVSCARAKGVSFFVLPLLQAGPIRSYVLGIAKLDPR